MHCIENARPSNGFLQPVEGIVNEENPRTIRLSPPSKLMASPHGMRCRSVKNCGAYSRTVVSIGPEMVVHHVEESSDPSRALTESTVSNLQDAHTYCRARKAILRHSPSFAFRENRKLALLNCGNADIREIIEPFLNCREGSFGAERTYVEFIDNRLFPSTSLPIFIAPIKGVGSTISLGPCTSAG